MITQQEANILKEYIINGERKDLFTPYLETGNDIGVQNLLNAEHSKTVGLCNRGTLMAVLMNFKNISGMPVWLIIIDTAADVNADIGLRASCRMILETAKAPFENIDLNLDGVKTSLDALLTATIINQEQRSFVDSLGSKSLSFAEHVLNKVSGEMFLSNSDISFILRGVR